MAPGSPLRTAGEPPGPAGLGRAAVFVLAMIENWSRSCREAAGLYAPACAGTFKLDLLLLR